MFIHILSVWGLQCVFIQDSRSKMSGLKRLTPEEILQHLQYFSDEHSAGESSDKYLTCDENDVANQACHLPCNDNEESDEVISDIPALRTSMQLLGKDGTTVWKEMEHVNRI